MSDFLTVLAVQPDFPREDLTDTNAEWLELMMANRELLDQGHRSGEELSWMFRVAHRAVVHKANDLYDRVQRIEAIDHGIATFEAINTMVGSEYPQGEVGDVTIKTFQFLKMDATQTDRYFETALDEFREQTPRTAEVVARSSQRFYASLTAYAVFGAALSRKLELDSAA